MITISSQADCDRIFGVGEVDFDQLVQRSYRPVAVVRFPEEKPPAGHHAPAPEEDPNSECEYGVWP